MLTGMSQNRIILSETSIFCWMTPLETHIVRWRIKFCIYYNRLEMQQRSASEDQRYILAESSENSSIAPRTTPILLDDSVLKLSSFNTEFNFVSNTTDQKANRGSQSNIREIFYQNRVKIPLCLVKTLFFAG
jgi:hypothetical protein